MTEAIESEGIRARLAAQRVRARLALVPSTPLARRIVASLQRDQTPELRHFYSSVASWVATPELRQLPLRRMWRTYNMLLYSRQPSRRGVACYRYPCPPYCHHRRRLARRVGDTANHDPPVSRPARLTTRPSHDSPVSSRACLDTGRATWRARRKSLGCAESMHLYRLAAAPLPCCTVTIKYELCINADQKEAGGCTRRG